jgi:hypothetical protein
MSSKETDSHSEAPKPGNQSKLLLILAGGAFALSLVTVILAFVLLSRPVADKIEQGNAEIKEALESQGTSLGKKMLALQNACIDWQAVLKTASDKPDALFKIVKTADGMLTLNEVAPEAVGDSTAAEQKK